MSTVSIAGQYPDRLGKAVSFHGLIAKLYTFKTKKIPAGRLMLGDWLGHHRVFTGVGIFAWWGVRKLVSDGRGLLGTDAKGLSQLHR